jgi:hypothetical protein
MQYAEACTACDGNQLVPRSTVHQLGAAAMMKGVCDASDSLGLVSTLVELRAALALALNDGDAEKGWFRGEDVFCDAPDESPGQLAARLPERQKRRRPS